MIDFDDVAVYEKLKEERPDVVISDLKKYLLEFPKERVQKKWYKSWSHQEISERFNYGNNLTKASNIAHGYLRNFSIRYILDICPYFTVGKHRFTGIYKAEIVIPPKSFFYTDEGFYQVLFHEIIHSSKIHDVGAEKYVKEEENHRLSTHNIVIKYSGEEIIAEFGALCLSIHAGILTKEILMNSIAYFDCHWFFDWKSNRKNMSRNSSYKNYYELLLSEIFYEAEKAVDMVLSKRRKYICLFP